MGENDDELKKIPFDGYLGSKVPKSMEDEVDALCEEKEWNKSAFIRRAIQESLDKVKSEGSEDGEK